MRIQQQRGMSRGAQASLRYSELERKTRTAAAEIDAALESPMGIDQSDPRHARASWPRACMNRAASQPCKPSTPSASEVRARQPVAAESALTSVTYQGWSPGRQSSKPC